MMSDLLQVGHGPVVESPATGCGVRVLANQRAQLVDLRVLRNGLLRCQYALSLGQDRINTYDTTGIEERLETALRPRIGRLLERLLVHQRGAIRGLGELVPRASRRSAELLLGSAQNALPVLADEGPELIELRTLGDCVFARVSAESREHHEGEGWGKRRI